MFDCSQLLNSNSFGPFLILFSLTALPLGRVSCFKYTNNYASPQLFDFLRLTFKPCSSTCLSHVVHSYEATDVGSCVNCVFVFVSVKMRCSRVLIVNYPCVTEQHVVIIMALRCHLWLQMIINYFRKLKRNLPKSVQVRENVLIPCNNTSWSLCT